MWYALTEKRHLHEITLYYGLTVEEKLSGTLWPENEKLYQVLKR